MLKMGEDGGLVASRGDEKLAVFINQKLWLAMPK